MKKQDVSWSKKTKTQKINYFGALGQLFKGIKDDSKLEAIPECKTEKEVNQKKSA